AALDVVSVNAIEGRTSAGVLLQEREESLDRAKLARLLGGGRIGGVFLGRVRGGRVAKAKRHPPDRFHQGEAAFPLPPRRHDGALRKLAAPHRLARSGLADQ